jgi:phosphomannomutase
MLSLPADDQSTPRICPVCGEEVESTLCKKDGARTFSLKSVAGRFVQLRAERGKLSTSELLGASKMGYDLRIDFSKVSDERAFKRDLELYLSALEDVHKPKLVVFSRDHRRKGELMQDVFDCWDASAEKSVVYGQLSTTMSAYLGALLAKQEGKKVLALQATASHNPAEYNGIKAHGGRFKRAIFPGELEVSKQLDGEAVTESYVRWCTGFPPYGGEVTLDLLNGAANFCVPQIASKLFPNATLFNDSALPDFGGLKPEPKLFVGWTGFGAAFDGDADRAPFYLDSKVVFFSRFLAGMAKAGLVKEKKVIADQRTPPHVINFIEEQGIKVVVGNIGNTNQVALSEKEDALWYEENWHSGGYPVKGKRFHWGEAPFAVAFWLSRLSVPVDKLLEGVPAFDYTEERFSVPAGFNAAIVDAAEAKGLAYAVLPTGGIRIEDDKGHMLLRESNTELGTAKLFATGVDAAAVKEKLAAGRELIGSMEREAAD